MDFTKSKTRKLINELDKEWANIILHNMKPSDIDYIDEMYNCEVQNIYPPQENLFEAFKHFSLAETKVVILGQDPYYKEGQAHGLAFSVKTGVKIPASLRNIFVELRHEYLDLKDSPQLNTGNLIKWAKQGVLLLNTALTVEENKPNIHSKFWKPITDGIIADISNNVEQCAFLLWGGNAHKKEKLINKERKHYIFKCSHPSPLAAHRGNWFYNMQFVNCNIYLKCVGKSEIEWLEPIENSSLINDDDTKN